MTMIDPALLRPDAILPETAAFNAELEAALRDLPPTHEVPVEETRRAREEGRGLFPPGGPCEGSEWLEAGKGRRVRLSPAPGAARGVYLHIHGGGWTLGNPAQYDLHNQRIAREAEVAVVSVEYRLAPEHPWPAGPDDCLAAALWTLENAGRLFGTERLVIGGESAGAHLSAVTLLRLREAGRLADVAGAVLNYGAFDLRMTPSAANWGPRQLVLSTPTIAWFTANFAPDLAVRKTAPASPLLADLADMPPALFQIGTMDPLLDDTLMMAARWAGAGREAELRIHPGGIHAFNMFDLEITRDYQSAETGFIRRVLG